MKNIVTMRFGSHLYGTATPASDRRRPREAKGAPMSVVKKILDILGVLAVLGVVAGFIAAGFAERGL